MSPSCRLLSPLSVDIRVAFARRLRVDFVVAFLCVAYRLFVSFFVIVCLFVVSASPFVAPSYLHLCRLFLVAFVAFLLSSFTHLFPDVTRGRRRLRRI